MMAKGADLYQKFVILLVNRATRELGRLMGYLSDSTH